ncbi:MAG: B12-binding domain-containing radical SAM protein [Clostridia bacterium]|nr:B12-binding domain-containing radical SAM protein [Clostridia bacterium]
MKILFFQPAAGFLMRGTTYPVCRGIMTTATYMKSKGFDVRVHDRCIDFSSPKKTIEEFAPDIVTVFIPPTVSTSEGVEISRLARQFGAIVVWAEVIAFALAEQAVENGVADFVINGEAEVKLELLVRELNGDGRFESIPGLTYLENGLARTTANANLTDLNTLPMIDWELIDVEKCFRGFPYCKKMLYMYTSRGCPFRCGFCYNATFYCSVHRKRPIEFVLGEIKALVRDHGLDGVNFSDELLLLSDEEIEKIASFRCQNGLNFYWGGEVRADIYRPESLRRMYDAGCRWLLVGIETGSPETRKKINKPMELIVIRRFVDACSEAGIATFGSFIIGIPGEKPEDVAQTAQFALSLDLDAFLFNFFAAIPKTALCDELVARGLVDISGLFGSSTGTRVLQCLTGNYSEVPNVELKVVKAYFDWLTFTRKKNGSSEKHAFAKKAVDTLRHFAEGGLKATIANVYNAGKVFVSVVYYSHSHKKIRDRYGLYNVNKKAGGRRAEH